MSREPVNETFRRLGIAMRQFRDAYERSRRAQNPPPASGGRLVATTRTDESGPYVLSRGAVAVSRAQYDAIGPTTLAALHGGTGTTPDVTVVESDGTLTEIEGSGP